MSEAAAKAIWDTWCASPAGKETAPEGGALSWPEMVKAGESGKFPALAEIVALTRLEAHNAIAAHENERNASK
jgi:hypothetical protein